MSAIEIPEPSLVVLLGVSETFAHTHFTDGERGTDLEARLRLGQLCVVEASVLDSRGRKALVELARRHHVQPIAIVTDGSIRGLEREGFRRVVTLQDVDDLKIARVPLRCARGFDHGPFDIVGDVHGCFTELQELLDLLGYARASGHRHAAGRKLVFVGDLVDRGPDVYGVLELVMKLCADGTALCVLGNHEAKLRKKLGAAHAHVAAFIDGLPSHYVLDDGKLVVAHAGLKETMQGRESGAVHAFALYGDTTGETDTFGKRSEWATSYRGSAVVVHGHTPVREPTWVNDTLCIDTGCVYGGKLTALRYPERELVSVASTTRTVRA